MSYKGFLGGVRVSRPSPANLRPPPLRVFLTASLNQKIFGRPYPASEKHFDAVVLIDQGNSSIVTATNQDLKWRFDSRTVVSPGVEVLTDICMKTSPSKVQLRSRLACQGGELKITMVVGDDARVDSRMVHFRAEVLTDIYIMISPADFSLGPSLLTRVPS